VDIQMKRYQIAQSRGFKGNFREFLKTERTAVFKENPKWKRIRKPRHLEEHIVSIVEGNERVGD